MRWLVEHSVDNLKLGGERRQNSAPTSEGPYECDDAGRDENTAPNVRVGFDVVVVVAVVHSSDGEVGAMVDGEHEGILGGAVDVGRNQSLRLA